MKKSRKEVDAIEVWMDYRVLTDEEKKAHRQMIEDAFGAMTVDHPTWRAIMALLSAQLHVERLASRNPALTDQQMRQQLGRETMVEDIRGLMAQLMARTRPKS